MIKRLVVITASLAAVAGLGYLKVAAIGKPISTDLSTVGQGRPALVLVYENYSPAAADALKSLNQVRGDYSAQLDFVIADLGVPQGRAFANQHQLGNGQAMFMSPEGVPVSATFIPVDEQELRGRLDSKLASLE
jgi:hypothetical protein